MEDSKLWFFMPLIKEYVKNVYTQVYKKYTNALTSGLDETVFMQKAITLQRFYYTWIQSF